MGTHQPCTTESLTPWRIAAQAPTLLQFLQSPIEEQKKKAEFPGGDKSGEPDAHRHAAEAAGCALSSANKVKAYSHPTSPSLTYRLALAGYIILSKLRDREEKKKTCLYPKAHCCRHHSLGTPSFTSDVQHHYQKRTLSPAKPAIGCNMAHARNKRAGALSHRSRLHLRARSARKFSWRWMLSALSNQGFSQANCDIPPDADSAPSQNILCPTSHEAQGTWELSGAAVTKW